MDTHQMFGFEGRVALVTGASSPVGDQMGTRLAELGAIVVGVDLPGTRVPNWYDDRHMWVHADVTEDRDWSQILATVGDIDVLINNAARYAQLGKKQTLLTLSNQDWDDVLRVNVRGVWQAVKWLVPRMRKGSSIINLGSVVTRSGIPGFAHYVASKAAVEGFTRAAARELGPQGIRVNTIAPGLIDNESSRSLNPPEQLRSARAGRALGEDLHSEDLVGAALWLASPMAAQVTGQCIVVDGGGTFT